MKLFMGGVQVGWLSSRILTLNSLAYSFLKVTPSMDVSLPLTESGWINCGYRGQCANLNRRLTAKGMALRSLVGARTMRIYHRLFFITS